MQRVFLLKKDVKVLCCFKYCLHIPAIIFREYNCRTILTVFDLCEDIEVQYN